MDGTTYYRMIPQAKFAETNIISNRYTTTPRAATAASAATTSTSSTSAGELPPSTSTTTASVMSPDADGWFKGYVIDDFDPNFFSFGTAALGGEQSKADPSKCCGQCSRDGDAVDYIVRVKDNPRCL